MIDQSFDLVGPYGSERISALEKSFKIIIENTLPVHIKIILKCLNEKTDEQIIDIARSSTVKGKTYSKYNIKDENLTTETLISNPKYTKEFIQSWKSHLPILREVLFGVKRNIQDMHQVKIELLQYLKSIHEHLNNSFNTFSKFDFAEMAKISTKADAENLLDPNELYELGASSTDQIELLVKSHT